MSVTVRRVTRMYVRRDQQPVLHGDIDHSMLCVRVPRALHHQVKVNAILREQQLSAWITEALEEAIAPHRPVPGMAYE